MGLQVTYRRHAWIPAVVPADALRFRVHEQELGAVLQEAGAELVTSEPDVEIGPVETLRGDAGCAVVPLEAPLDEVESRTLRAARRVARSVRIRREARRTEVEVRNRGYRSTAVVTWELDGPLRAPWLLTRDGTPNASDRFPLGALVVAQRSGRAQTVLEAAITMVQRNGGAESWMPAPTVRAGMIVAFAETGVLRIAVGRGRFELQRQRDALEVLRARLPGPVVADRVPWPLGTGRIGLADWSLERRLPGRTAPDETGDRFLTDCVEFLAELFLASDDAQATGRLAENAAIVASAGDSEDREAIASLTRSLELELAGVPGGLGHGDFWGGNLLAKDGRLVGVVDWDAAGPGCLPLLDLFHLRLSAEAWRSRRPLGHVIVDELERPATEELTRAYCERIGLAADSRLRRALLAAYWLDYVAYQLRFFVDPTERPRWIRDNLGVVSRSLASPSRQRRRMRVTAPLSVVSARRRRSRASPRGHDVIVLCYHGLSDRWPSPLAVTPKAFDAQLRLLVRRGYRGSGFTEAVLDPPFAKTVAVTFDDAYHSVLELASPLLAALELTATVFVPTSFPERQGPMSWPGIEEWLGGPYEAELAPMSWGELRTLAEAGWEIGSHTKTHPRLTQLTEAELDEELKDSRLRCEAAITQPCRSLAYPYGDVDARVVAAAARAGYEAAGTLPSRFETTEPLAWPRVGVYRGDSPLRYRAKISPLVRRTRASGLWTAVR